MFLCYNNWPPKHPKSTLSDNLGLVDFAIGLVNSVVSLHGAQVRFLGEFKLQKNCNQSCSLKDFEG